MKDTFGRVDGDVLAGIERAAHTGRRVTGRRARRQKRVRNSNRGWSIGSLTVAPVVVIVAAVLVLAGAAGAAIALGGKHTSKKEAASVTPISRVTVSTPTSKPAPAVKGIYIRYADAAGLVHYMYCTKAAGCGLLDVAKDGTSKIAVTSLAGVWHREQRVVIRHDPCINIVQNAVKIGKPGDFVSVRTTDLRRVGTQVIKGIAVPARIAGDVATRFEYPDVPGCDFTGTPDFTRPVNSPVTEYVPVAR